MVRLQSNMSFILHDVFVVNFVPFRNSSLLLGPIIWSFALSSMFFPEIRVAQWVRSMDITTHTSLSPIQRGFAPSFWNYKKGALDSQPKVIKFTSWLPIVSGSLRASFTTKAGRHDIAEILLKVALNTKIQIQIQILPRNHRKDIFGRNHFYI